MGDAFNKGLQAIYSVLNPPGVLEGDDLSVYNGYTGICSEGS